MAESAKKAGLRTRWADRVSLTSPLAEYPRPQFVRPGWLCLNGRWDFAVTPTGEEPKSWGETILVPFSPETALSGVARGPGHGETAWYRRSFTLPEGFMRGRLLLHFGASDQFCEVRVNGHAAGGHEGGYEPFTLDVTEHMDLSGANELTVSVRDECLEGAGIFGKQSSAPGGIWYTGQSGLWQTVWMESVPEDYIPGIRITPCEGRRVVLQLPDHREGDAYAVFEKGRRVLTGAFDERGLAEFTLPEGILWTPEEPFLYDLLLRRGRDIVKCYFALRTFSAENGQLLLNGEPIFLTGLLDQGYWPESLYTPPTDEAMIHDIETAKRLGYNLLRKHVKVEPLRWYYHCDRLGMMVWQDIPNGGGPYSLLWTVLLPFLGIHIPDGGYKRLGRRYERARRLFQRETEEIVSSLYNCPSIIGWTLFNEGWGQFETAALTEKLRGMDALRPIDSASGWHDQKCGDLCSRHIYFKKLRLRPDSRVQAITEFGGYSLAVSGHSLPGTVTGYKKLKSARALTAALEALYREQVLPLKAQGLCQCVYTQLSDVETELNGLLTWDREILKVDEERIRAVNEELKRMERSGT